VARAIAGRAIAAPRVIAGRIIATDYSEALLAAARELARAEGVGDRIELQVQDSHALTLPDGSADIAIAHTLVSHLADPRRALAELARVLRPGGTAVVFDGDYASLAFGGVDQVGAVGEGVEAALVATIAANPTVLRTLPGLAAAVGLEIIDATAHVLAEVGTGTFFVNFAETYAPMAADAGLLRPELAAGWLDRQRRANRAGTFFAACNYYTYLLRRPG
jgi:SAM-dependent methyltransferase